MRRAKSFVLERALGSDAWRAKGVDDWETVVALGVRNQEALLAFLQAAATRSFSEGDREEAADIANVRQELSKRTRGQNEVKPLLPRLRRESFGLGERVSLYLGDIPRVTVGWGAGSVVSIEKAYRDAWRRRSQSSAYYWRVTVRLERSVPGLPSELSFSTSEPRAVPSAGLEWLREHRSSEPTFLRAWAASSTREWQPLWCEELGVEVDTQTMAPLSWL